MKQRILIVAPNWIGDAVLSLPTLALAADLWPDAELTVLARTGVAEMFALQQPAVRLLQYQTGTGLHRSGHLLQLSRRLRRKRFHLALLLPNSFSSAMIVWLAGIPCRVGYATDGRTWLLSHPVSDRRRERGLHQADYYLHLIRSLESARQEPIPHLRLDPHFSRRGLALLNHIGVSSEEILIGVHPGAAFGESKRWFPSRFAAVLDRMHRPGRRFLLVGGPGEETLAEEIEMRMSGLPVNLVGKTSVAEVIALIDQCDLFLSNDSGLMHVAAALGIPQVALFGSTDPQKTAPLNDRAVVIHPEDVSCTPCFRRYCQQDLQCMKAITVDEVYVAAERSLLMFANKPKNGWSK